ncbi:MAG: acetoacetate decarboxylase family protein [Thermodesulfobacteriota bacterium]
MNAQRNPANPFFSGIVQTYHREYDVTLPIFYYDASAFTGIYTAPTQRVKAWMPFPGATPLEILPGRSLIAISAFEYRDTDIAPYNEFSVAALVSHPRRQITGLTLAAQFLSNRLQIVILSLPVTSERARKGGVEMAGYPKFLADIEFTETDGKRVCVVSSQGNRLLTFYGSILKTKKGPRTHAKIFTTIRGNPMGANLYMNQLEFAQAPGWGKAGIDIGRGHGVCDMLADLRLSKNPLAYQFCPRYEAILFNSKNLMDT